MRHQWVNSYSNSKDYLEGNFTETLCGLCRAVQNKKNRERSNCSGKSKPMDFVPTLKFYTALGNLRGARQAAKKACLLAVFRLVEEHFSQGLAWEQLEAEIQQVPEMADTLGELGPLWVATQLALQKKVRATEIHKMIAYDILHNLEVYGKMQYISPVPGN